MIAAHASKLTPIAEALFAEIGGVDGELTAEALASSYNALDTNGEWHGGDERGRDRHSDDECRKSETENGGEVGMV